jgi:L-gulonolactone oxidase
VPERWTNWARQQVCAPAVIERPRSEAEVAAAVRRAGQRGMPVRAVGSGHSFTDIACTDGVMLDLSAMDAVLEADPDSGRVRVQPGISINALGRALEGHGLALENQGDVDTQALAGALATATHGTGLAFGNLSSRVEALRLVDGRGEVRVIEGGDQLLAARVALGALGVVSELTLRCVPLFTLRRRDEPRPLGETLDAMDGLVEGADHWEFYVFPYSELALTRTSTRSDEPPEPVDGRRLWLQENVLENAVVGAFARTGRTFPRVVPRLDALLPRLASPSTKVDLAWRVFATRRAVRFTEMEYAIPRACAREAVEAVLALVERRRLPVTFPIEVRFTAGDDAFLSTAHGRETCYVAVHQYVGVEYETYFRAVEQIMDGFGGRPHWGKRHYQSAATLSERYPQWDRFLGVRGELDPHGRFENPYVRRVLGPA